MKNNSVLYSQKDMSQQSQSELFYVANIDWKDLETYSISNII